jgi:hypothetical protein
VCAATVRPKSGSPTTWTRPQRHHESTPPMPCPPTASITKISSPFHSPLGVLFIFRSRYLFAIGLFALFSFRRRLPPCFRLHSQTTRLDVRRYHTPPPTQGPTGLSPSLVSLSRLLGPRRCAIVGPKTTIRPPNWQEIFGLSSSHFTRRYCGNPS